MVATEIIFKLNNVKHKTKKINNKQYDICREHRKKIF